MTPSGILGVQYRIQGVGLQQENVYTFTNYELCQLGTLDQSDEVCTAVLSPSISSRPACKSVSMLVRHWRISWAVPCSVAAWYAGRLNLLLTWRALCLYSVNVGCGPAEERVLLTGLHAVADIYCECCKTTLGWKYVSSLPNLKTFLNCQIRASKTV